MVKKTYSESVKKWAINAGIPTATIGTSIGLIFLYLSSIGAIDITGFSGDQICEGTIKDPCYAYINLTAKEDIFIYPIGYDPWGRETIFEFSPSVKEWKFQRKWGNGWRDIPLNETCTGTWCGAPNSEGAAYSYALRESRAYEFRIVAYKNSPYDTIKWAVNYEDKEYLDPAWISPFNEERTKTTLQNRSLIQEKRSKDSIQTNNRTQDFKTYESENRESTIFNQNGELIIQQRLNTPYSFRVDESNETLIAEVQVVDWKNTEFADFIVLYDAKNNYSIMNRTVTLKYAVETIQTICKGSCYNDTITEWISFKSLKEIPTKNVKVGIFTETRRGERIEWVIINQGFEVLEWADVTVDGSVSPDLELHNSGRNLVWVSNSTGYVFFTDDSTAGLYYRNTTNGGTTWGEATAITQTDTPTSFSIWYDRWTYGDEGTIIHIAFQTTTNDALYYDALDTTDESLRGAIVVGSIASAGGDFADSVNSITKSRNGTIFIAGSGTATSYGFFKANMSGEEVVNFIGKTNLSEGGGDRYLLLPGRESNPENIWAFYQDASANSITLKVFNDTANTWSESASIDTMAESDIFFGFDAVERFSDGHVILAMWEAHSTIATPDPALAVHNVTNITSFSQLTSVDAADSVYGITGIMINQQDDMLFVAYSTATTAGTIAYKNSTNGGLTWGSEIAISETADDHRMIGGGTMVTTNGGKFRPVWFNDDLFDVVTSTIVNINIPPVYELIIVEPTSSNQLTGLLNSTNTTILFNFTEGYDDVTGEVIDVESVLINTTPATIHTYDQLVSTIYNFSNADQEGITLKAYACEYFGVSVNPPSSPATLLSNCVDESTTTGLDADDTTYWVVTAAGSNQNFASFFSLNTETDGSQIEWLNITWVAGAITATNRSWIWIYNDTASAWVQLDTFTTAAAGDTYSYQLTSTDYISSTGIVYFIISTDSDGGTDDMDNDFFNVSFSYIDERNTIYNGENWEVNVTLPDLASGTYNLFMNATYQGTGDDTEIASIIYEFPVDTTKPTVTSLGVNSTYANRTALFYAYWNDNANLTGGGYIFETNNSGTLTNNSFVSFTTTPSWANVTKLLNATIGNVIAYRWYANDTAGNWNVSAIQYLTTTSPPTDTCTYSSGNWGITCSDNCTLISNTYLGGNNLTFTGIGVISIWANITGIGNLVGYDGCVVVGYQGGSLSS